MPQAAETAPDGSRKASVASIASGGRKMSSLKRGSKASIGSGEDGLSSTEVQRMLTKKVSVSVCVCV